MSSAPWAILPVGTSPSACLSICIAMAWMTAGTGPMRTTAVSEALQSQQEPGGKGLMVWSLRPRVTNRNGKRESNPEVQKYRVRQK